MAEILDWKYDYQKPLIKDLNLLFLDIDGVLNFASGDLNNSYNGRFLNGEEIEPKLVKNLNKIFEEIPNLKIVISSSWRVNMKKTIWALKFAGFNYIENIIGKTDFGKPITKKTFVGKDIKLDPPYNVLNNTRGEQILKWFLDNPGIAKKLKNFIIIDDEDYDICGDMGLLFLKNNTIVTCSKIGLSNANVQDIINHFIKEN